MVDFMNNEQLIIWVLLLIVFFYREHIHGRFVGRHYQGRLGLIQFVNAAVASCGVLSSGRLIHLAATSQQLKTLLGSDIVTLFIGAAAIIWVTILPPPR